MGFYFRHGLGRTDFYILNDPELSFREIVQKNLLSAVSGSFSAEIIEATKSEVTKSDTLKTESTKLVTVKSELSNSESPITKPGESEVKLELIEPQEIKAENVESEEKVEISETISSDKSKSIEAIVPDKNIDNQDDVEKLETSNDKSPKPMELDNDGNNETIISNDNSKQEVSEQLNEKGPEIIDQKNNETPETIITENTHTDTQEINKDESHANEVENIVTSDDVESKPKPSVIKENTENINDSPSDESSKPDIKVIEPTIKSKECSTSTSVESVDRLKAMFPELEVVHKDITVDKLPTHKPLQQIDQTIAHLLATSYQNPIKWPKVNYKLLYLICVIYVNKINF